MPFHSVERHLFYVIISLLIIKAPNFYNPISQRRGVAARLDELFYI
jgi:hypothetical protein